MKPTATFKAIFASTLVLVALFSSAHIFSLPRAQAQAPTGTCGDHIDNDGDGRVDWTGGTINGQPVPPDPACLNAQGDEYADQKTNSSSPLIPCVNKCDLGSVMQLLNNLITFLIKVILFPISILLFVYAGYTYIISQGEPGKRVKVKSMIKHLILGIVLILCAWIIVKTLLVVLGYTDSLYFFE